MNGQSAESSSKSMVASNYNVTAEVIGAYSRLVHVIVESEISHYHQEFNSIASVSGTEILIERAP
jgi:hypothetical protein